MPTQAWAWHHRTTEHRVARTHGEPASRHGPGARLIPRRGRATTVLGCPRDCYLAPLANNRPNAAVTPKMPRIR
jgi:hypothetical protein